MRRRRLGDKPISHDASVLRTLVGSTDSGAGSAPDSAQYLVLATHTDLLEERVFTPGDGLAGSDGGAGGNYTVSVNVGNGLEISTDIVQVDLASPSGLSFSSGDLQLDDSIAGDGIAISAKVLSIDLVDAWSGLEISGGELRIDLDAEFAWTADHSWDADTLAVDVSEDAVYINVPNGLSSPPTYRGALTLRPTDANQKAQVIQAFASQAVNLWEVRASDDTLKLRVTADGDLESGSFTSGVEGWAIDAAGNAEFSLSLAPA